MSFAPKSITALSQFWTDRGGVPLGIVGNQKHCSGYHLGRDRIYSACACKPDGTCEPGQFGNDYSVQHKRDKAGLTDAASAIDLGKLGGTLAGLYDFSEWLVKQCMADRTAYRDIREVIYWSASKGRVQRYSGVDNEIHWGPGNGDLSHKTHTHITFFRDSVARDKVPMFAPYFALPDTSTGDTVKAFLVPEVRTLATVKDGAWLYMDSALASDPGNIRIEPGREFVYVGKFSDEVRIVAYEPVGGDVAGSSRAMFIRYTDIASTRQEPDTTPYSKADVDKARAEGYAAAKAKAVAAVGAI